ncbi:hypothetical protein HK104_009031, partial [Borealophlyctis nickersoniae]
MAIKLFITGATGYIGGSILTLLLNSAPGKYDITALVRDDSRAQPLSSLGVTPLVGSLDDAALLEKASAQADVILNIADADHVGAAKAILSGMEQRAAAGQPAPILIHTSGTGVLLDNAGGAHPSPTVVSDKN